MHVHALHIVLDEPMCKELRGLLQDKLGPSATLLTPTKSSHLKIPPSMRSDLSTRPFACLLSARRAREQLAAAQPLKLACAIARAQDSDPRKP